MTKAGEILYLSGVKPRTNLIWRAFARKNSLTVAEVADLASHLLVAYDTSRLYSGKNSEFKALDQKMRQILEEEFPENYKRIPLLQRLFGRVLRPVTREELEAIELAQALEEQEK